MSWQHHWKGGIPQHRRQKRSITHIGSGEGEAEIYISAAGPVQFCLQERECVWGAGQSKGGCAREDWPGLLVTMLQCVLCLDRAVAIFWGAIFHGAVLLGVDTTCILFWDLLGECPGNIERELHLEREREREREITPIQP